MKAIQNILIAMDSSSDENQPALKRAVEIAEVTGANLFPLITTYEKIHEADYALSQSVLDNVQTKVLQQKKSWLKDILKPIIERYPELNITPKVCWHERLYEAIIQEAVQLNCDMVIKSTHEHSVLKRVLFTPTDWSLLRKCPIPVMLIKSSEPWKNGKILASVDSASQDYNHIILNQVIIETADHFAQLFNAQTNIVNACPTAPNILPLVAETVSVSEIQKSILASHKDRTLKLVEQYNIPNEHVHIEEGSPEHVVASVAERLNVDLVVLGTIARTGIPGVLIGNTAERLLESLNVDILALKPSDYVSPLDLELKEIDAS